ncbi:YdeI/OmpD-associated family protein [Chloroflexi bacterium TSY]|nr:YdeI/OmpD-associated family protein [Chloroflexi bacterium TSY]
MSVKPENVDQYLESGCGRCEFGGTPQCKVQSWDEELRLLRGILQESRLTEELKWGAPCYTHNGKNILMLSALKESVTISFFRGALMKDPENVLEKPGENSRFARYIRFTNVETVATLKPAILRYIQEAIELENSGKKSDVSNDVPLEYPEELIQMFEANPDFEEAFSALTPGRQRGYLIHFTSAKQSKTKTARIEKCMPKILIGKGWNER